MKKITFLLLTCLAMTTWSYGQCTTTTGGAYPSNVVNILNLGTPETIAADNWPNAEFSGIGNLIVGNTYTITGTNTTSLYITVAEALPDFSNFGTVITHGASSVSFTATTTGIYVFWHLDAACNTQASDNTATTIQCTSASCTCTETAVPACTTAIAPVDGELNTATSTATDGSRQVAFSWDASPGAISYEIVLDGNVLGSTPNTNVNIFGLDYSTAYTWSVNPINCFGTATGCPTWSFTTEADPGLSTQEFTLNNQFKVYPNPANNVINIKTDLTIDAVEVYNQIGQRVITIKGENLTDSSVNIQDLNKGVYFIKVMSADKTQTIKFIKE